MRPTTLIALVGSVLLTACAHQGADLPREGIITPMAALHRDSIEERRQLAKRLRDAGELAAAVSQWKVLTILHPDDAEFRKELESTLATLSRSVAANYENGLAALKDGNNDEAARFMLQVLALEPGHTKAAKVLRGIEAEKIARVQIVRANRARSREDDSAKASPQESAASEMAEYRRSYDLEQTIEMFVAGDAQGGLRELHRFVNANPKDKASRRRIAEVVFEQAQKIDTGDTREHAATLYEEAIQLRGDTPSAWAARLAATRKTLANEYYEKGMRVYRSDFDLAIKHWENCLKYSPQHGKCTQRLKEARSFKEKMKKIDVERRETSSLLPIPI